MTANAITYAEKDQNRRPIEWNGFKCEMLGTISEAGIIRRMDGTRCTPEDWRNASDFKLNEFCKSGKWLFEF